MTARDRSVPDRSVPHHDEVASATDRLLAGRRMCRDFRPDPLPAADVAACCAAALGAPAAGNTWGLDLVVLEGEQVARYWDTTLPVPDRPTFPWPGLLAAPVLLVPYVEPAAWVARYGEADKVRTGLGAAAEDWPVPYWWVDGGAAVMAVLVAAAGRGLGALFFGQFDHEAAVAAALGVPDVPGGRRALGTVALGRPADGGRTSRSGRRGRPPLDRHVHRGGW